MIRSIIHSAVSRVAIAAINFAVLIICARYLGVTSRGEISLLLFNISVVQIVNELFTGYGLVRFIPALAPRKLLLRGYLFSIIACVLINLVIVLSGKQIPGREILLVIVSFLVVTHTFHCIVLLGKQKVRTYNMLSLLQPALLIAGIMFSVFVLKCFTLEAYLYPLLLSFTVGVAASGWHAMRLTPLNGADPAFSAIIRNGFYFQAVLFMHYFCSRYCYYLLDDKHLLGLYSSATTIAESAILLAASISPVILARAANNDEGGNTMQVTLALQKAGMWFAVIVLLVLSLIPESWYLFVLSGGFAGIRNIIIIYSPAVIMMAILAPVNHHLSAIGKQSLMMRCYFAAFAATILLLPFAVSRFGINGAVLGTNLSFLSIALLLLFAYARLYHVPVRKLLSPIPDLQILRSLLKRSNS